MPRNLAQELADMGIEADDQEYQELAEADQRRQERECERQHHQDYLDFLEWRRRHMPQRFKHRPL